MVSTRRTSSRLDERLEDVERRLRELRRTIRALERGGAPRPMPPPAAGAATSPTERPAAAPGADRRYAPYTSEEERQRFARYLPSAGFDAGARAPAGGRVRRNQLIAIAIAVAFLLFLIYRALF